MVYNCAEAIPKALLPWDPPNAILPTVNRIQRKCSYLYTRTTHARVNVVSRHCLKVPHPARRRAPRPFYMHLHDILVAAKSVFHECQAHLRYAEILLFILDSLE